MFVLPPIMGVVKTRPPLDTGSWTSYSSLKWFLTGCLLFSLGYIAASVSQAKRLDHSAIAINWDSCNARELALQKYVSTPEEFELLGATSRMQVTVPPWIFAQPQALWVEDSEPLPPSPEDKELMTAQEWEDASAHECFFAGRRNGMILESGALDGVLFSVSNFFVRARGWRAVHVEGSPRSFEALARNRPESLNINAAICTRLTPLHYAQTKGENGSPVGGFWEFMNANLFVGFLSPLSSVLCTHSSCFSK